MKFALIVYQSPAEFAMRTGPDAREYWSRWAAFGRALHAAGAFDDGVGLEPAASAKTVRVEKGRPVVQDGPYADTKDQLGGVFLLHADTLEAARSLAQTCPATVVELRPLLDGL